MVDRFVLIAALSAASSFALAGASQGATVQATQNQRADGVGAPFGRSTFGPLDLTAQQQQAMETYAGAMSRASLADTCANQRKFHAQFVALLTPRQLRKLRAWEAAHKDLRTALRDELAIQKNVRTDQTTYNAMVSSEAACRATSSSCVAAARAASIAASALQSVLLEELAITQRHC